MPYQANTDDKRAAHLFLMLPGIKRNAYGCSKEMKKQTLAEQPIIATTNAHKSKYRREGKDLIFSFFQKEIAVNGRDAQRNPTWLLFYISFYYPDFRRVTTTIFIQKIDAGTGGGRRNQDASTHATTDGGCFKTIACRMISIYVNSI